MNYKKYGKKLFNIECRNESEPFKLLNYLTGTIRKYSLQENLNISGFTAGPKGDNIHEWVL